MPKSRPCPHVSVVPSAAPGTVPRRATVPSGRGAAPKSAARVGLWMPSAATTRSAAGRERWSSTGVFQATASAGRSWARAARSTVRGTIRTVRSRSSRAISAPSGRRRRAPCWATEAVRTGPPASRRSRASSAAGHRPRAVPVPGRPGERSSTWTSQPAANRPRALARPAMPAPMMTADPRTAPPGVGGGRVRHGAGPGDGAEPDHGCPGRRASSVYRRAAQTVRPDRKRRSWRCGRASGSWGSRSRSRTARSPAAIRSSRAGRRWESQAWA